MSSKRSRNFLKSKLLLNSITSVQECDANEAKSLFKSLDQKIFYQMKN